MPTTTMYPIVIAFDGPAASGKGTLATRLAADIGFAYFDCGLLYRAFAKQAMQEKVDPSNDDAVTGLVRGTPASTITELLTKPNDLRNEDVALVAAKLGASAIFYTAMYQRIRTLCENPPDGAPGTVLDGRAVGTNLYPEARHKFYITADTAERAYRRYRSPSADPIPSYSDVFMSLVERDQIDMNRHDQPLRPALDAVIVDTTGRTVDQSYAVIFDLTHNLHRP